MRKTAIICLSIALLLCLAGCKKHPSGWAEEAGHRYYYSEDGIAVTGWLEIDGSQYYFGPDGILEAGFQEVDGLTYYLGPDGAKATGWINVNGRLFYLRQGGSLVTGWLSLDGQRYYLTETGAATGIHDIEGKLYVFDQEGRLATGWVDLGEELAYGDSNGHPVTGWLKIDNRYNVYFREDFTLQTGWAVINGITYCFNEDGSPKQGITPEGEFASNGQQITLVNPWHEIPEDYTVELTAISEEHKIATIAYADYVDMIRECTNAGNQPAVCSSYRTQEYQEGLYERKVQRVLDDPYTNYTEAEARIISAREVAVPGTSEHQLGLALDIVDSRNWNLDESQASMPTQQWLMENSWRYGWILRYPNEKSDVTGIIYEPWHYRYVGREVAAEIHAKGLCLEEYLQSLTVGVG